MNEFAQILRPSRKVLVLSLLGLAAFLALEALLMRRYTRVDTRPPSWDQSVQLEIALDYRRDLAAGRASDAWFLPPKPGMPPFPPAYGLLLRGAYDSPDPAHAALWYNWLYLAALAVSLFGMAWRFLPDSRALAGTILFCAAPGIQGLYTTQLADLSVVACVAAAYWALLECEGFSYWPSSLAFGAAFAVGMLHKWSFFSYLLPAYMIGARALAHRSARWRVLASAALALGLSAPWYASHILLLPSRLVQASSDFGVPFWKGGAWLVYLRDAAGPLGPILWGLGFVGLLAPQYTRRREYGWVLAYWVLSSYVFWTIVPNRQIRFLLPGLAPLGLAFAASWPARLCWAAAAFQLLALINFFFGWIPTLTLPTYLVDLPFFVSGPPVAEKWPIADILRRVAAERDPSRPLTNVTLVANDADFNGPTFHWEQSLLGLKGVSVRGVNRRLCELSEFVILKDGRLGPEGVIGGLPEAAEEIRNPAGWFAAIFAEDARWPLPDGSTAVLYRLRRFARPPWPRRSLDFSEADFGDDGIDGLSVRFGPWSPERSAWDYADLRAARARVRGLVVSGIGARLYGFSFAAPGFNERGNRFDFDGARATRLDRVEIQSLSVSAEDLKAFLAKRVPGLVVDSLTLDGDARASGRYRGRPVSLEAALELDRAARVLRVRVVSASYMGTPLPSFLFRPVKELTVSLAANPETPFDIDLAGLTLKNGLLTVP